MEVRVYDDGRHLEVRLVVNHSSRLARIVRMLKRWQQRPARVAGLHAGAAWMSDDFDAPLPEDFLIRDE